MATTIKAMLNRDRVSKSGMYPLIIRVIHNRRKKLIYSPYKLKPEEFDERQQKVIWSETSPYTKSRVEEMNKFIRNKKTDLERLIERLEREKSDEFTVHEVVVRLRRQHHDRYLLSYFDSEITAKQKTNRLGTAEIYTSTRNSLRRFVGNRKVTFKDVNYRFLGDYINHLRERKVCENTISMYLRNLRAVYNKARKEGLTPVRTYPFDDIKMRGAQTVKRALTKDTLRKIVALDLTHKKSLDRVRDIFLFSFYSRGMSLVDILHLRHSDIANGYIHYVRNKTSQHFQVAIEPQLQELIDKYRSNSPFVMPYLNDNDKELNSLYRQYRRAMSVINANLKTIGMMVGVEKPLTSYVARHSWATIAETEGVPIATISEGLGHTTEKTTQIYLRAFDHRVIDKVNAKIIKL